jgi:Ca2+-transporting ATPase
MTVSTPPLKGPLSQGTAWHTLSVNEALRDQSVDQAAGLSPAEAEARLKQYGPNTFAAEKKEPGWRAFLRQYQDPMQIVLLVAGIVSGVAIQQWGTALLLLALTLFNALMGLRQEGKAEASVAALQQMMIVKSKVRRGGQVTEIPAEQLVTGDIVVLEAGDRVPADGRIIRAATLEIDESALTGESAPVPKQVRPVASADTPLGDRVDMAYMNTEVTRGAGDILVTATGMATEVGHISGMLQTTKLEQTPLTKQLNKLTNQIVIIAVLALIASLALGYAHGQSLNTLFLTGVAFAIAAIPTGLPAIVTFLLATGTTTLANAGAIVKRLRSIETLGSTSAINSDKTGTLTLNQMTAIEMAIPGQRFTVSGGGYSTDGQITHVGGKTSIELDPYLLPMALASDAVIKDCELVGDPTEGALVVLAAKGGIDAVTSRQEFPRVAEVPFDATYKLMATFHKMKENDGHEVIRCFVRRTDPPPSTCDATRRGGVGSGGEYSRSDPICSCRCALGRHSSPHDGIDHILDRQHLLCAGDQRPTAIGVQQGDAREPQATPDVWMVATSDVPGDRVGLHEQDFRDSRPDRWAVGYQHCSGLVGPVAERDCEDLPATGGGAFCL